MRPVTLLLPLTLGLLAAAPARCEPVYFTRDITDAADCAARYDELARGWRHHAWFTRHALSGGREHVLNCLPDGVEEFVCNPGGGKLAVAIAVGETEPACRRYTPTLPLKSGRSMLPDR